MNENLKIHEQRESLKKFLELFPVERMKNLTLEEYSNRDNECFTYHGLNNSCYNHCCCKHHFLNVVGLLVIDLIVSILTNSRNHNFQGANSRNHNIMP